MYLFVYIKYNNSTCVPHDATISIQLECFLCAMKEKKRRAETNFGFKMNNVYHVSYCIETYG